jgi:glutamyl-tRNA synthetase
MTPEQIIATIVTDVQPAFVAQCTLWNHDVLCKAITLYQERVKTLKAMVQEIMIVHNGVLDYDQDDMLKWISSDSRRHIDAIVHVCQELPLFDHQTLSHAFKALATSMTIKLVTLLQPVRLALIGKASGPGVFDLLEIIGKEESIARLSSLRAILDYER